MKKHIGNLKIREGDTRDFSKLEEITGYLYIYGSAKLEADNLTSVGGNLYINRSAKLEAKFLKNINWKSVDGYLFIIESEKTTKGINVLSGYNAKSVVKGKLVKRPTIYVAEKDNFQAHGDSINKAIEDLQFKIISEKLKKEPINKDTVFTIQYYRLITGACELGVKEWMQSHKIEEGITAEKLLPTLEKTNAYGVDKFKSLITW